MRMLSTYYKDWPVLVFIVLASCYALYEIILTIWQLARKDRKPGETLDSHGPNGTSSKFDVISTSRASGSAAD